jgi:hypothetical protein
MLYKSLLTFLALKQAKKRAAVKLLKLEYLKSTIRTRHYVTCDCLKPPSESNWNYVYEKGTDTNFVALTSLTRSAFNTLLQRFREYYYIAPPLRVGRPNKFQHHHQALGLILVFYCDTIGIKNLCQIFGIPPATISRFLYKAEVALNCCLESEPLAAIKWPSLDEQHLWASKVEMKNELVQRKWGFIDGKNYRVQTPTCPDTQNALYNGWLHSVFVTGTMCFGADGTIVWYRHNCPGSWNDGETSRRFQEKLSRHYINLPGHGVLSDSAFPVRGAMFGRIVTPLKENDLARALPAARFALAALSNAITSLRQSAEWGMGAVEKVYRRLLERLPYNPSRRALRLKTIFHLYNFRVRTTNISQIRSYFDSVY